MNDFVRPESMEVPDGGLATFLTATVGDWADDDEGYIPQSGIGGVKSVADKLAEYGRYEDTYMVHAAEGPLERRRLGPAPGRQRLLAAGAQRLAGSLAAGHDAGAHLKLGFRGVLERGATRPC